MCPNDFGDPLTFPLAPSSDHNCNLLSTLAYDQNLQNKSHSHQGQLYFMFSADYQMLAC